MSVTFLIILLTCLVSFPTFKNEKLRDDLLFWPYEMQRRQQYYRFLSAGVVHADMMHLLFNMVSLYSFGMALEKFLYPVIFHNQTVLLYVVLYLFSLFFSTLPDFFTYRNQPHYRALGASGAVSAVIFAAIAIEPSMPIRFFFIPIDIPGYIFGILFLAFSAYLAKKGQDNIGHSAHFWGAVFGLLFTFAAARLLTGVDLLKRLLEQIF